MQKNINIVDEKQPTYRCVMMSSQMPVFMDRATWRRIRIVEFKSKFKNSDDKMNDINEQISDLVNQIRF